MARPSASTRKSRSWSPSALLAGPQWLSSRRSTKFFATAAGTTTRTNGYVCGVSGALRRTELLSVALIWVGGRAAVGLRSAHARRTGRRILEVRQYRQDPAVGL